MSEDKLLELLTTPLIEHLKQSKDDTDALRRALIHCVLLLDAKATEGDREFIDFLLGQFAPLASAFRDNKHGYFPPFEVLRTPPQEGHRTLALPVQRLKAWLQQG